MSNGLEIYLMTKYLPNTHDMMNADRTITVLKVLTPSLGKSHVNKPLGYILHARNVLVRKPQGRTRYDAFCGFQSLGNLQRGVHPRKGEGGPSQEKAAQRLRSMNSESLPTKRHTACKSRGRSAGSRTSVNDLV